MRFDYLSLQSFTTLSDLEIHFLRGYEKLCRIKRNIQIVIFRNARENSCEVIKKVKDKSWFDNGE